ncbi:Clathrin light chain 3 [Hibiscus syriacus]|uniref:Clathrin light chain n=1 Tax=Hibiscus syriacus TaxID=106335 RepID=A0A6A2YYW3_HIBSY|nr:clathrin light chain 2-like [Hibiscus syriacus]KAE8684784.1 Clathrin light chain 3 [Hibiscus syriacus]
MSSFDDDGYLGYDPRLASHQSQSFDADSVKDSVADPPPMFNNQSHGTGADVVFSSQSMPETPSLPPIYGGGGGHSAFSSEQNGEGVNGDHSGGSDGPTLPPPAEMEPEEGSALREWRRKNLIRLQEKDKKEKEMVEQIIKEADEYKAEFYKKISIAAENNRTSNRNKEKIYVENREKFHGEAEKNYWKAIAELVPHELPTIEKGKKDKEKQPSIVVIQGPKPGKPTDLARMRKILVKLKHNPPPHMNTKPPPPPEAKKGAPGGPPPPKVAAATNPESIAAA